MAQRIRSSCISLCYSGSAYADVGRLCDNLVSCISNLGIHRDDATTYKDVRIESLVIPSIPLDRRRVDEKLFNLWDEFRMDDIGGCTVDLILKHFCGTSSNHIPSRVIRCPRSPEGTECTLMQVHDSRSELDVQLLTHKVKGISILCIVEYPLRAISFHFYHSSLEPLELSLWFLPPETKYSSYFIFLSMEFILPKYDSGLKM